MNDRFLRRILILFVAIFGVLIALAAVAMHYVNVSGRNADWVNHLHATVREIDGITSSVQAGDGAMRAFVLTGDPRDRAASRVAFDEMTEHFDIAKPLTRDDPATNQDILALEALGEKRIALAESIWTAREQNQTPRIQALLATDAGSGEMAEIKRAAGKLREDQFSRLASAEQIAFRNAQTTRWIVSSGLGANLLLLGAVGWLIYDGFNARRKLAETLKDANIKLEAQVQERTAELVAANAVLTSQAMESRWSALAMEHQLRYSDLIINSVNDVVFVLTRAMHVTRINSTVVAVTGHTEVDLLNQPLDRVLHIGAAPDGSTPSLDMIAQSMRNGRELRGITGHLVDKRQKHIPVRINLLPLRDRDKVVGGVVTAERIS